MSRRPQHPRARLNFEAGEIVVLELRANRQPKTLRHDRNFILHKAAVEIERAAVRAQRHIHTVCDVISSRTKAQTPNHILAIAQGKSMLQIDVAGIAFLSKDGGVPFCAIVIRLHRQLRVHGKAVRPPAQ